MTFMNVEKKDLDLFAGLDWLTLVLTEKNYVLTRPSLDYLTKLMKNMKHVRKPWNTALASGEQHGKLKQGTLRSNKKLTIVIVSSHYSSILASWSPKNARATRIDFCVDVHLKKRSATGREFYSKLADKLNAIEGSNSTTRFIKGKLGGWTFYTGCGGSSKLLRVYDKGSQMNGKDGLWIRYELQVGRDYATNARKGWLESTNPTEYSLASVQSYCQKKGVYFPSETISNDRLVVASKVSLESDENERMWKYMRNSVVPFIKRFRGIEGDDVTLRELGF